MSAHIDRVRRAIEFGGPDRVPMELVDVPHVYNAYGTLDPDTVLLPPGAEDFDSAWCTYHWTLTPQGVNGRGEPLRRDEWGCEQVVPADEGVAYTILARPGLSKVLPVEAYPWPDIAVTDPFFERNRRVIEQHYPDRFICGFIDPGPFLVAFEMLDYDGLLMAMADRLEDVKAIFRRILRFQKGLVPRFKAMGAHMVNIIDEVAGTGGMMFSPDTYREHFLAFHRELIDEIHSHNMYASILLDGNIAAILPDVLATGVDQLLFAQPHSTGYDAIREACAGKRCVKLAVDMMTTLAQGSPAEIEAEVARMVSQFHSARGGLVFQAMRWHRPAFAPERVAAQIRAMNAHGGG